MSDREKMLLDALKKMTLRKL